MDEWEMNQDNEIQKIADALICVWRTWPEPADRCEDGELQEYAVNAATELFHRLNDEKMEVYLLEADLNGPTEDYFFGIQSVHASFGSAMAKLDGWLTEHGVGPEVAHTEEVFMPGFVGNDVELGCGLELSWGINLMDVSSEE